MYFSVVRGRVFRRADVSIVDYTKDELVSNTGCGVVKEIVLDSRFVDGL